MLLRQLAALLVLTCAWRVGGFTCCTGQASCGSVNNNAVTCSALGNLYSATGGSGWSVKTGWSAAAAGTATSYCTFYGASCTVAGSLSHLYVT